MYGFCHAGHFNEPTCTWLLVIRQKDPSTDCELSHGMKLDTLARRKSDVRAKPSGVRRQSPGFSNFSLLPLSGSDLMGCGANFRRPESLLNSRELKMSSDDAPWQRQQLWGIDASCWTGLFRNVWVVSARVFLYSPLFLLFIRPNSLRFLFFYVALAAKLRWEFCA